MLEDIVGLSTVKASFLHLCLNNSNSLKPLKHSSEPLLLTLVSLWLH